MDGHWPWLSETCRPPDYTLASQRKAERNSLWDPVLSEGHQRTSYSRQKQQLGKHRKCQWHHKSRKARCPTILIGHPWGHFVPKPRHSAPVVLFPPNSAIRPCSIAGRSVNRTTGHIQCADSTDSGRTHWQSPLSVDAERQGLQTKRVCPL